MNWDLEDFMEEVKFQMTNYDLLEEEKILEWEHKARQWVMKKKEKKYILYRSPEEIYIKLRSEDVVPMENIARLFYQAVKEGKEETYWKSFQLLPN